MSYLLDTNVVSEWLKPQPDAGVVQWLAEVDEDRVYISVITLAELRHGIERLEEGRRRRRLDEWVTDELSLRFESRLLSIDQSIANAWGRIVAQGEALGQPIGAMDAFIAATAQVNGLTLVTRNTVHFRQFVQEILNPWKRRDDADR